jgi:hypothetical protein
MITSQRWYVLLIVSGVVMAIGLTATVFGRPEHGQEKRYERTSIESFSDAVARARFELVRPPFRPDLRQAEGWIFIEDISRGYQRVQTSYQFGRDLNHATITLGQQRAGAVERAFVAAAMVEDEQFTYQSVRISDTGGRLFIPKYGPLSDSSYDPRRTAVLAFLKGDTYIELRTYNSSFFTTADLIALAVSLQ